MKLANSKNLNNISVLCDELDRCVANQIPVLMVVAVVGSTEESAVDPLARIIELRDHYCYQKVSNCCERNSFYSTCWKNSLEFLIADPYYLLIRIYFLSFAIVRMKSTSNLFKKRLQHRCFPMLTIASATLIKSKN